MALPTMRSRLLLALLLTAPITTACPGVGPDGPTIEETGPQLLLDDEDADARFQLIVSFEPADARRGYVDTLKIISELERSDSGDPIEANLFLSTEYSERSGVYASANIAGGKAPLEVSSTNASRFIVEYTKRGSGTLRGTWKAVAETTISDYPEGADEPTVRMTIETIQ